jgi:CheY-like chemotaxis protein
LDLHPSVLVVDPLEVTSEVLRTALEPRGVQVYSAADSGAGLELARRLAPDLVVLDVDCEAAPGGPPSGQLVSESRDCGRPMIVLGKMRRGGGDLPSAGVLSKPYHYGALIRRIEQVLAESGKAA